LHTQKSKLFPSGIFSAFLTRKHRKIGNSSKTKLFPSNFSKTYTPFFDSAKGVSLVQKFITETVLPKPFPNRFQRKNF